MSDRKKPGVAFWVTVGLALLILYVASAGPVGWLSRRDFMSDAAISAAKRFYWPLMWAQESGPKPIRDAINWYTNLWE